jgi:hypothetical protein
MDILLNFELQIMNIVLVSEFSRLGLTNVRHVGKSNIYF